MMIERPPEIMFPGSNKEFGLYEVIMKMMNLGNK